MTTEKTRVPPARETLADLVRRGWPVVLLALFVLVPDLDVDLPKSRWEMTVAVVLATALGVATPLSRVREFVVRVRWMAVVYVVAVPLAAAFAEELKVGAQLVVTSFLLAVLAREAWAQSRGRVTDPAADVTGRLRFDLIDLGVVPVAGPAGLTVGDRSVAVHGAGPRWWVECRTRTDAGWVVVDERDLPYDELVATARAHLAG